MGCIVQFFNGPLSGLLSTPYTEEEVRTKIKDFVEFGVTYFEIINPERDKASDSTVLVKGDTPAVFRIVLPVHVDESTNRKQPPQSKIEVIDR